MDTLYLTPWMGVLLVIAFVISGYRFRRAWKAQPAGWQRQAWVWGVIAAICLCALAFVPLKA